MRYYITIQTSPNSGWRHPQGWEWDSLADGIAGARQADRLWMSVRLWDAQTGEQVGRRP